MTGVAAIVEMTSYQMANGHKYSVSSLITIVVGGSPMRPELQKSVTENLLFGRIPIKQGYGSTEQGIIAHWSVDADTNTVKDGSVGRPGAGIEIKVTKTFFYNQMIIRYVSRLGNVNETINSIKLSK